jgi:cytoskeletal protein CcmA (bactofilin family)
MALFSSNREQPMARQAGISPSDQLNMIGEGTVFEGTLRAESDVRISGRLVGKLQVSGRVLVAQEGMIEGELAAANADIAGVVQGDIHVEERLVLKSSARVEGNIRTARIVVEEGALFNGKCQMTQKEGSYLEPNGADYRTVLESEGDGMMGDIGAERD